MGFDGFPKGTKSFFKGLASNTTREWFEAHRGDFDASVMAPAKAFVAALAPELEALDSRLVAEPRLNGSIRRIHRDVRFSKDKTPYSTQLHLIFWAGDHPLRAPAHHLVIAADRIGFGAGHWGFEKENLARYRAAVAEPSGAAELAKIVAEIEAAGAGRLQAPALKKLPKGYAAEGAAADLLRHKGLVVREESVAGGAALFGPEAVPFTVDLVKRAHPLVTWLLDNVYE